MWKGCKDQVMKKCSTLVCTVGGNLRRPTSGSAKRIRIHKKEKKNVLCHSGFSYAIMKDDTNQDTAGKLPPTGEISSSNKRKFLQPVYNGPLSPMLHMTGIPSGIPKSNALAIAAKRYKRVQNHIIC
jgi:hypothetical protein